MFLTSLFFFQVCTYTKMYYCDDCHTDELSVIPTKIVFGWNFVKYRVCAKAKLFLDEIKSEPIVDVMAFNDKLFKFSTDLEEIFALRKQLSYMSAYFSTCR